MKDSKKLVVTVTTELEKELSIAWATTENIESIVEEEGFLEFYTADETYSSLIEILKDKVGLKTEQLKVEEVKYQNWNEEWEANFKPIEIDNIYIRAPFHEASAGHEIDLVISPKMAFGTGHHETTYMMLQHMNGMDLTDKTVLDYGCGTGILTVFAKMKGCAKIAAIDIQEEAIENTLEHFELNQISTSSLKVEQGNLDTLAQERYEVILANINRHVLLANAANLKTHLSAGGKLIMSGILKSDRELIISSYKEEGFILLSESQKGEWCCFRFGLV